MKKWFVMAGISLMLLIILRMPVYAADLDEIIGNMVLETSTQAELYKTASDQAEVVASLEAGTAVFTTEKAENNWCRISAGEYTGYIKVECLKTIGDRDLIDQELEQNMSYDHRNYDEAQQLEDQKNREKIIGKATLVLVAAVFVAGGILTGIQTKRTRKR